jgi:hypothetical protein
MEANPALMEKYPDKHAEMLSLLAKRGLYIEPIDLINKPMGPYNSFSDCVSQNQGKEDPEAYCGKIYHETHGKK